MSEADTVSVEEHLDKSDEEVDPYVGTMVGPDLAPSVERLIQLNQTLIDEINKERQFYDELGKQIIRTNPNMSGSVQFRRYAVGTINAMSIIKEKRKRGDAVIHCYSGSISIGSHSGIMQQGSDTVEVEAGGTRTIRTRHELWAIGVTDAIIDIQEEFD